MKTVFASLLMGILSLTTAWSQNNITFEKEGYYPEGVAYYPKGNVFLVGSMTAGEIATVAPNGHLSTFIADAAIISPIGLKVNPEKQLLYVCNSDIGVSAKTQKAGQGKTAQVLVYDLVTKKRIATYDLAAVGGEGYFFANDLAYDPEGNLYVTNSFGPQVWKITPEGKTSVFATNALFQVEPNHFGLNGIVYHPDGYLLVAHYSKGKLYKIPTADPTAVSEVNLSFTPIGADGLELVDEHTLVIVANGSDGVKLNAAYTLQSNTDWKKATLAQVTPLQDAFPTTTTQKGHQVYVLYAHLDAMLSGADPKVKAFEIIPLTH